MSDRRIIPYRPCIHDNILCVVFVNADGSPIEKFDEPPLLAKVCPGGRVASDAEAIRDIIGRRGVNMHFADLPSGASNDDVAEAIIESWSER